MRKALADGLFGFSFGLGFLIAIAICKVLGAALEKLAHLLGG